MADNYFDKFDPSTAKPDGGGGNYFDRFDPATAKPEPKRTWGEAIKDTGAQLAEGVNTTLGAIPSVVAPQSKAAGFFRDNAEHWRDKQSDVLKGRIAETDKRIQEAGKDGVMSQIGTAASEYWNDPAQAARLVATNLPSMAATLGAGAAAGFAAKGVAAARGMDAAGKAALAAKYGTTTAAATNAALNAGGARGEAFEDLQKTALAQGMSPEQAEQAGVSGSILPGVVGGVAGAISGKMGLEKALLGQATAGAATRKAAGAFGAELAGEQIEELAPKVATNYQVGQLDAARGLTDDLGRTMVETAIGAGPGAVVAGGAAGMRAGEDATAPSADESTTEPGAPATPQPQAGPTLALPAPDPGVIAVGGDGTARTPAYQKPSFAGEYADVTDVVPRALATQPADPVRTAVESAANSGGALSNAALVAIDSGVTPRQEGAFEDAPELDAQPQQINLDDITDPYDRAYYESLFDDDPAPLGAQPVLSAFLQDDDNIPDFDAANNVSEEDFLRALGADELEIQDAIATTPDRAESAPEGAALPAGPQADVTAGTPEGAGAGAAQPAGPVADAPTNLRDALAKVRAQKQEAANAQAAPPQAAPAAAAVPAAGPGAVEAAGSATTSTTTGVASEPQTDQTQQASTQPAQAGAAQPPTAGLTDAAPAENHGAQGTPAPGAQAQTSDAAPAENREQRAQRVAAAGESWTRMPAAERQALAQRTDLRPVVQNNVHRAQWADLNGGVQRKIADAMAPAAGLVPRVGAGPQEAIAEQGVNLTGASPEQAPVATKMEAPTSTPVQGSVAAVPTAKKVRGVLAKKVKADEKARTDYFAPGNIVRSYGGHDRVISYTPPGEDGQWSVTVRAVEKQGDAWMDKAGERERAHATPPDAKALKAGPVKQLWSRVPVPATDTGKSAPSAELGNEAGSKSTVDSSQSDAVSLPPTNPAAQPVTRADVTAAQQQAPGKPIEDFGEKIGGARKDRWKERGLNLDDLDSMSEAEGAELATKANVWKPDYEALSAAAEPVTAAMVKTIYDKLAAKPKKNTPEGRRQYVQMMRIVRDVYTEAKGPEAVKNAYLEIRKRAGLNTMEPQAKAAARELLFSVYKGRSDPFVLDGGALMDAKKMVEDGFPAKGEPWKSRLTVSRREGGNGTTERGIEMYMELSAEVGTPLTREQIEAGFFRVVDKKNKAVAFAATKEDAEAAAKTVYERDMKGKKDGKPEPVRPNLDELKRENLPKRIERDVAADDFVRDLGFRGIEFGLWSAQDERQRILNMAYDGLMDLAEIMGVPPKAMSLNGTLGMAFGARGGGRFAAHYEPGKLVINMTKIRGGGSMAHEWAHAMDHYFGELGKADAYTTAARGASGWYSEDQYLGVPRTRHERVGNEWKAVEKMRLDNLRPEMSAAFDEVMRALFSKQVTKAEMVRSHELDLERTEALARNETQADLKAMYQNMAQNKRQALNELRGDPEGTMYAGRGRTEYASQAQALSGKSIDGYWVRPTEMFARAFESWVFDRVTAMGAKSDYLVHGVEENRFAGGAYKGNPYPTGEERARINAAFDKLAQTIQTKETEGGNVAMFSRTPATKAAYEARIDALYAGGKPLPHGVRVLDRSDMLGLLGMGSGPVHLVESKVEQGRFNHGLSADDWKKVPGWLDDPAMVFDSETQPGRLVFIAPEMVNGSPVRMIVDPRPDGQGVNLLVNAYDADRNPFQRWERDGLMRYFDQQKAPSVTGSFQPRLTGLPGDRGRNKILTEKHLGGYRRANTPAAFMGQLTPPADSNARNVATQLLVDGLKAKWTRAPEIIVARNMQDTQIPQAVRDYDATLKSQGASGEARGFIYKGKVYLLSDQLMGPQQIAEVLFHEVLGHFGLRGVFGKGLDSILQQMGTMRRADVVAKAREYGLFDSDALGIDPEQASSRQIWEAMSAGQRLEAAEEVLAEMAQTQPNIGFVQRAIAAIRNWLRAHVPGFRGMKLTDADIVQAYIMPARGYVTRSNETAQQAIDRAMMAFSRAPEAGQTQTEAFAKWFGDSKVVDAEGKPLVVYHGTIRSFDAFDQNAEPFSYERDRGKQFFLDNPRGASDYAIGTSDAYGGNANVMPVYLRMENPRIEEVDGPPSEWWDENGDGLYWELDVSGSGHDGLIVRGDGETMYVTSNPVQIKSATGNNGDFDPDTADIRFSRTAGDQTQTDAFKKWFGDSKVVDADSKPLMVYHGSRTGGFFSANPGKPLFFSSSTQVAQGYAGQDGVIQPAYLNISNPMDVHANGDSFNSIEFEGARYGVQGLSRIARARGYDGLIVRNIDDVVAEGVPHADMFVTFGRKGQVKSATGNNGAFDPANPDIRFSRAAVASMASKARDELNRTFAAPGKLSWWHKSVGTMYNLAERSPVFKRVFDSAQGFVDNVSHYATDAAELAPKLLPKLETWRDIAKRPISAADNASIAKPINEGTLDWARDEAGKPVRLQVLLDAAEKLTPEQKAQRLLRQNKIGEGMLKAWQGLPLEQYEKLVASRYESQMLKAGIVWTPAELKSLFQLTDAQVALYQEFRAATDRSLDTMARSDMLRFGGEDVKELAGMVMEAPSAQDAAQILRDHLLMLAKENPDRAGAIGQLANGMLDRAARVQELQEQGYAPLSRFGKYTVDVVDAGGERQYFGLFETAREANIMAMKMRKGFGQDAVTQGTLSNEEFKLLAGITPESLELFGNMLGLDATGNDAQDLAFQEYLRRTKTNRSAMRRLIHRQGIAGYSEDVGRVLASFIYSNARQTSAGLHMGDLGEAITEIPKQQGELKDAAIQLSEYVKNPQEEAQMVRGLLFAQYLGGSIASAVVNMTQPVAVSFPWLSQFGGAKQAATELGRAAKNLASRGHRYEADLAAALKLAEEEGTVSPQEVHQLMAQARGSGSLRPGDGTRAGDARAAAGNALTRLSMAWGKVFGVAEQVNRRMTFIAAYRVAKTQGMANPSAFAKKAVVETQFVYSKANKMKWGRGAVGATVMTFKTYSIAYIELLHRMYTQGGPEGKQAVLLALAVLMLMGGAGGLPFAEDAEDLADGLAQMMGYNFNSKKAKQELLESVFGEAGAGFVERGISGLPGMPLDVSGRLGMGNLLPGTGIFKEKTDHTRDVLELVGPVGDLAKRVASGGRSILTGDVGAGLLQVSPVAVRNAAKGADMAARGMYRDDKGYKVIDTTPTEAAMKAIGFQPASVAKVQEANFINQQAKNFYSMQAQEIRALWARGIFEQDQDLVEQARAQVEDWNRKNPDQRMVIAMPAVFKRVREMSKTKDQRIADTAPKAMRQALREESARARAAQ